MTSTPKRVRSVRIDDERLAVIRRRQAIDVRFGGPSCAVDGEAGRFSLRPSDVAILDVMARERDPLAGGRAQRTAYAALAELATLESAEVLVTAAGDERAHPGLRVNALVALQRVSPGLGRLMAEQLGKDKDAVVRGVAHATLAAHGLHAPAPRPRTARATTAKRTPRRDPS
jgi:hypothetical protein